MVLTKKITDKKVNFEFNKEFINVFNKKIKDNDTEFLNKTLKLFKSTHENANHNLEIGKVVISNNKELKVATHDGFVHIHELQLSGKKRMKTADFLRGYSFEDIILH